MLLRWGGEHKNGDIIIIIAVARVGAESVAIVPPQQPHIIVYHEWLHRGCRSLPETVIVA